MNDPEIWSGMEKAIRDARSLRRGRSSRRRSEPYGVGVVFEGVGGKFFCLDLDGDLRGEASDRLRLLMKHFPTWGERSISQTGAHLFYRGRAEGKTIREWRGESLEIFGSTGFIALTGEYLDASHEDLGDGAELLRLIDSETKEEEPKKPERNGDTFSKRLLVEKWLQDRGIVYRRKDKPDARGRAVYVLKECPFNPDHEDPDACIMQAPSGQLSAQCFHKSCAGRGWQDFKAAIGPPDGHHYDPPDIKLTWTGGQKTPPGGTTDDHEVIVFESLDNLRVKPVRWEVPGRFPRGKVTLVAGDGGMGKSHLDRHLTASITSGRPAFGMQYAAAAPGDVVMFALEDGYEDVVLPSLIAEGADLKRVHRVPYVEQQVGGKKSQVHFGLEHLAALKAELATRPEVRLIVIDPIASFIGRCQIDDHKTGELRRALDPLNELADQAGVGVIVIAHVNKAAGIKAVYRIAGSHQYTAAVRLAYIVGEDPDDPRRRFLMPVKKNLLGVEDA